jgi:hypothetical protein
VREIRQKIVEKEEYTIEKPVIKEVIRTVEVDRPVVQQVPVIREVKVYQEPRTVYAASPPIQIKKKRTPSIAQT